MSIQLAADLQTWVLFADKKGKKEYLVGSLELDKYLVVPEDQLAVVMTILENLKAGHTPSQIQEMLEKDGISTDVHAFCRLLAEKGLLTGIPVSTSSQEEFPTLFHRFRRFLRSISWQMTSIPLEWTAPYLKRVGVWFWVPFLLALLLTSAVVLVSDFHPTALRHLTSSLRTQIPWIIAFNVFVLPLFIFLHEAAHALAASITGKVFPRRLSLRFFLCVPYFSLQLPGLYTLPFKERLSAIAAGPLMDLLLGNVFYILANASDDTLKMWLFFLALANYSRFLFNVLPILPMTDGYAFISQAFFREVDVRKRVTREFRRWRQGLPNNFSGQFVFFFLLNNGVVLLIVIAALRELNTFLIKWLGGFFSENVFLYFLFLFACDSLIIYLMRNRLRALFIWA